MEQPSLDNVRRELAATRSQLEALPADAWGQRSELRERLAELRAEAAAMAPPQDPERLREQIDRLTRRRDAMARQLHAYSPASGQGYDGAPEMAQVNREMRTALGIDELEAQIGALRRLLDAGDDPPA